MKKQQIINFWLKLGISQNNILKVLGKITGLDTNQLFLNDEIDDSLIEEIEEKFSRLVSGEPIEYIINKAEFYGLEFYVDSRVLVPRNDTEVMVDKVVESIKLKVESKKDFLNFWFNNWKLFESQSLIGPIFKGIELNNLKNLDIILIDIWTGSWCIPISILKNLSTAESSLLKTFAIDISNDVLEITKINIKKHNLEDKIELIKSDLLESFGQIQDLPLQKNCRGESCVLSNIIITANLPYIKNWDFENMDEETITFEPDLALYWGEKTGFELYEKLIFQIFELKNSYNVKNIILFIEIWFDQKQIAINFLKKQNLKFEIFKDNGGIDRCIKIYF